MTTTLQNSVAKKEYVTYPCRFERPLYNVVSEHCDSEEMLMSQYIRKLVKKDLEARGKWPVKG